MMYAAVSILVAVITCVLGAIFIFKWSRKSESVEKAGGGDEDVQTTTHPDKPKGNPRTNKKKKVTKPAEFTHPLLLTNLKGHGGEVTSFDVSSNGKYLISTAEDRSLFVWTIKDLTSAGKGVKSVRGNVEYDNATLIKYSPDNRAFIASLDSANSIRVFKIGKGDDGSPTKPQSVLDFPRTHTEQILDIGIDSAGNYVMSADISTRFDILSLKGDKLQTVDTGTMKNSCACVSPCGRFVAVSGFTPDVKVWEVVFDKTKEFKTVKRVFELTGHKAGVLSIAFSADSSRIATVAKDSTWKLWKADVEYGRGEDASLLCSGSINEKPEAARIALSPDGKTVAIATENNIVVYNTITQQADVEIRNIFASKVRHLLFSVDDCGKYLLCCGDRQVRIFNNITGYKARIDYITRELQTCHKNVERRLTEQLEQARQTLQHLQGSA